MLLLLIGLVPQIGVPRPAVARWRSNPEENVESGRDDGSRRVPCCGGDADKARESGSCCTLPVIGAVAGYAGAAAGSPGRRRLFLVGGSLMAGTAISLAVVGAVTGFLGQMAGATLGRIALQGAPALGAAMLAVFVLGQITERDTRRLHRARRCVRGL